MKFTEIILMNKIFPKQRLIQISKSAVADTGNIFTVYNIIVNMKSVILCIVFKKYTGREPHRHMITVPLLLQLYRILLSLCDVNHNTKILAAILHFFIKSSDQPEPMYLLCLTAAAPKFMIDGLSVCRLKCDMIP